jgi:hypothetical protein
MLLTNSRSLVCAILACGFVAPTQAATISAQDVYMRSFVQSYPVGVLNQGQRFDVKSTRSGYHWGYAHGNFKGCTWVAAAEVTGSSANSGTTCPAPPTSGGPETLINWGYAARDPYPKLENMPLKTISCGTAGMYGNYRQGKHLDKFLTLKSGAQVYWRYTSPDKRSVMVMNNANPSRKWGYVLASCLK